MAPRQLWIHVTGWHSVLLCYERDGPGTFSPEDEDRYWVRVRDRGRAPDL